MGFKVVENEQYEAIVYDDESIAKTRRFWTEEYLKKAGMNPVKMPTIKAPADFKYLNISGKVEPADCTVAPYNAGGQIIYNKSFWGDYSLGSAQFCGADNMLLTAAHCVQNSETGEWNENPIFYLRYGSKNEKAFDVRAVAVKKDWYKDSVKYGRDYAFVVTEQIADVPYLRFGEYTVGKEIIAFGYPSNYGKNKKMQKVEGVLTENNDYCRMEENPMREGCSGGAWVEKEGHKVVGINSTYYEGQKNGGNSPKFTSNVQNLFDFAKNLYS